jgi:hypothetical protein
MPEAPPVISATLSSSLMTFLPSHRDALPLSAREGGEGDKG